MMNFRPRKPKKTAETLRWVAMVALTIIVLDAIFQISSLLGPAVFRHSQATEVSDISQPHHPTVRSKQHGGQGTPIRSKQGQGEVKGTPIREKEGDGKV